MNEEIEYRSDEISEMVGLKASRTRELLKILVEEDMLEALGEKRNRHYKKNGR